MDAEDSSRLVGYAWEGEPVLDLEQASHGATVFARKCFVCHSSKQPAEFATAFWSQPANLRRRVHNDEYVAAAIQMAQQPDFRRNNYFSTDQRYPVSVIGTHSGRSLADNALSGRVWEEFASETYRELGTLHGVPGIRVDHPYQARQYEWRVPRTRRDPTKPSDTTTELYGPGYYRPHTLIGIWATAPFLHNNSVGEFPPGANPRNDQQADVSVLGRLAVFEDSARGLLWPERRAGRDSIYRTTSESSLQVPFLLLKSVVSKIAKYEPVLLFHRCVWVFPVVVSLFGIAVFLWGRDRPRAALRLAGMTLLAVSMLLWWEASWQSAYPHLGSYDDGLVAWGRLDIWGGWLRFAIPVLFGIGLLLYTANRRTAVILLVSSLLLTIYVIGWESRVARNYELDYGSSWADWCRVVLVGLLGVGLLLAARRLELAMKIAGTMIVLLGFTLAPVHWWISSLSVLIGIGVFTGVTDLARALRIVGTALLLAGLFFLLTGFSTAFSLYPVTAIAMWLGIVALGGSLVSAARRPTLALRVVGRIMVLIAITSLLVGLHLRRNGLTVAHIPQGTPINLIANINGPGLYEDKERLKTTVKVVADLLKVQRLRLPTLEHAAVPNLVPNLLKINKCPDFVIDRGHTFGSDLSDEDKYALIEYLKTL